MTEETVRRWIISLDIGKIWNKCLTNHFYERLFYSNLTNESNALLFNDENLETNNIITLSDFLILTFVWSMFEMLLSQKYVCKIWKLPFQCLQSYRRTQFTRHAASTFKPNTPSPLDTVNIIIVTDWFVISINQIYNRWREYAGGYARSLLIWPTVK